MASGSLSASVDLADGKAKGLTITLLTRINNSVSTFGGFASFAASIGGVVAVHSSVITLLTNLNDAITTNRDSATIEGNGSITGLRSNVSTSSKEALSTSIARLVHDKSESSALGRRQKLGGGQNKPLNSLTTRGLGFRSHVGVGTDHRGQKSLQVNDVTAH